MELRLKLSSLAEIGRWILRWGGNACVVQPRELAASARKSAQAMAR